MKTRKYNGGRKRRKTRHRQRGHVAKRKRKTKHTNRHKKQRPNMKKTRRKRGGAIPLGPVITVGLMGLAAIVGPIAATYMDESNIERAKREADPVMKARAKALEGNIDFSEITKEQIWDEEERKRRRSWGKPAENEQDEEDEQDNVDTQMSEMSKAARNRRKIGNQARKHSEKLLDGSPYWDTSTGVATPILDDPLLQPSPE